MPKFEKFRRSKATSASVPMVSVHLRGIFALNDLAYEALDKPDAIELFYDKDERVIGMKGAPRSSPDAYAVRRGTAHSFQVEGRTFLKFYGIPQEATGRRYVAEIDDDILTIDLNQEPSEGTGE